VGEWDVWGGAGLSFVGAELSGWKNWLRDFRCCIASTDHGTRPMHHCMQLLPSYRNRKRKLLGMLTCLGSLRQCIAS